MRGNIQGSCDAVFDTRIAVRLGRAPSTVSCEIRRNGGRDHYRASTSEEACWKRALRPKACKLAGNHRLIRLITEKLKQQWSPQQIAGWAKRQYPDDERFTSQAFTGLLKEHDIRISMDGKGAWRDNVFIERLWRSVKYGEVYFHTYETVSDSRNGIGRYFDLYNQRRPHSAVGRKTPDACIFFSAVANPGCLNDGLESTYRIGFSCPNKRGHLLRIIK